MIQEDREAAEWFNKGIQQVLEMPELYGLEKKRLDMCKTKYSTELQARYHLTLEEAREIIRMHGLGYSTLEFTQALQVIEEDNELNMIKPKEKD